MSFKVKHRVFFPHVGLHKSNFSSKAKLLGFYCKFDHCLCLQPTMGFTVSLSVPVPLGQMASKSLLLKCYEGSASQYYLTIALAESKRWQQDIWRYVHGTHFYSLDTTSALVTCMVLSVSVSVVCA